ncbi:MAG: aromatic ring-hydroxylating dioxygenase subunit alpha, partial [Gammaproteobacteria bacterium]
IDVVGDLHKMWGDLKTTRKDTISNRLYKSILPHSDHLDEALQEHWVYYRAFPNLAFDIYPDQVDFMQFIPVSPTETIIREIPYALKDNRREMKAARYLNWRINRQVNKEDTDLVERVQDGMSSSSFTSGPFASSEICLIDSANKMRKIIPVSNMETPPPYGQAKSINDQMLEKR